MVARNSREICCLVLEVTEIVAHCSSVEVLLLVLYLATAFDYTGLGERVGLGLLSLG